MVIPEEREGKLENDSDLARDVTPANATVNTRQGGMQHGGSIQQKVCFLIYLYIFNID